MRGRVGRIRRCSVFYTPVGEPELAGWVEASSVARARVLRLWPGSTSVAGMVGLFRSLIMTNRAFFSPTMEPEANNKKSTFPDGVSEGAARVPPPSQRKIMRKALHLSKDKKIKMAEGSSHKRNTAVLAGRSVTMALKENGRAYSISCRRV